MSSPRFDLPRTLCQPPGGQKSCGACCGMYNQRQQHASHDLLAHLAQRTRDYLTQTSITDLDSLQRFRATHEPRPEDKLLDGLPSCPFLGLLDAELSPLQGEEAVAYAAGRRVGCMVHPLQNDGVDARDCGVYDRHICEGYLCAAHDVMRAEEKWLVLTAVKDSYLYGLVITDTRFVRELFEAAARHNGAYPSDRVLRRPDAVEAAQRYFELKRDWRYRDEKDGIFGQVVPLTGLDTARRPDPSASVGEAPDDTEHILRCLGTGVSDRQALLEARALVARRLHDFAIAVDL